MRALESLFAIVPLDTDAALVHAGDIMVTPTEEVSEKESIALRIDAREKRRLQAFAHYNGMTLSQLCGHLLVKSADDLEAVGGSWVALNGQVSPAGEAGTHDRLVDRQTDIARAVMDSHGKKRRSA